MPDPDPQPPQPRAVSPARWLLMLLPSAFMFTMPLMVNLFRGADEEFFGAMFLVYGALAVVLCFYFGFVLEDWRWGTAKHAGNPVACGFLILLVNTMVSFVGCSTVFHI